MLSFLKRFSELYFQFMSRKSGHEDLNWGAKPLNMPKKFFLILSCYMKIILTKLLFYGSQIQRHGKILNLFWFYWINHFVAIMFSSDISKKMNFPSILVYSLSIKLMPKSKIMFIICQKVNSSLFWGWLEFKYCQPTNQPTQLKKPFSFICLTWKSSRKTIWHVAQW